MLKQLMALLILLCFTLTGVIANPVPRPKASDAAATAGAKNIAQIRKKALESGVDVKVRVRLRNGEKLQGRITDITDESLAIQYVSAGKLESQRLSYADIADIHRTEKLSTGAWIAIGAGIGAGTVVTVLAILAASLR